jgi:uncharacterized membrane protein
MRSTTLTVLATIVISTIVAWVYGSTNFAINITVLWVGFALVELVNKLLTGTTISGAFWDWSKDQPRWRVWVVSSITGAVGIYFTLHLALRI